MKPIKKLLPTLVLSALMVMTAHPAAGTLSYQANDLGAGIWEYSYRIDGPFDTFDGFTLLYNPSEYSNVVIGDPLPGDWSQFPTDGGGVTDTLLDNIYEGIGPIDANDIRFTVEFLWLGNGIPGSQPYELFNASGVNTLSTVSRSTSVPEPASLLLVLGALLLLWMRKPGNRTSSFLSRTGNPAS